QNRLQELYEEVREYAAPIKLDSRPVDLRRSWRIAWKHIVEATPEMTLRLVEDIETEPSQWECTADPYRLEQVFLNIFENAMHASPPHSAIHVRCQDITLGEKPAIQISIQDEGSGMSREQRENIFEAFFTTKTKGTGLGMAIVRRIIHAHGGLISVADRDGPGTEILLQLPVQ
ncbi:MAG: sensor histidine kinase, partial [Planctomycetaceae bacterium]